MRKPIEQKPPLAAWATTARDEAQMSVEEVVDALQARGHAVTAATLRGIEGGSKGASSRLRKLLATIYDKPAPGDRPSAQPDQSDVAAAIRELVEVQREQTKAISALVLALGAVAIPGQAGDAAALDWARHSESLRRALGLDIPGEAPDSTADPTTLLVAAHPRTPRP